MEKINQDKIKQEKQKVKVAKYKLKLEKVAKDKVITKVRTKLRKEGHKFAGETNEEIMGYCMTCHIKVPVKYTVKVVLKTKEKIYLGKCPNCNTEIYKRRA